MKRAFKAALLWNKALNSASRKNYAESLGYLRSVYDIFETRMPSETVSCDINILCANVACKLGDYDLSISAVTTALSQLEHNASEFSQSDKNYLSIYCRDILRYCAYYNRDERAAALAASIKTEFDPSLLRMVRQHIKRKFPM